MAEEDRDWISVLQEGCENTSVSNNSREQPVGFYPNPVKSILYLKELSGESRMDVYNMLGEKSCSSTVAGNASDIDLSELPDALYSPDASCIVKNMYTTLQGINVIDSMDVKAVLNGNYYYQ